jgi:hypothetical protein
MFSGRTSTAAPAVRDSQIYWPKRGYCAYLWYIPLMKLYRVSASCDLFYEVKIIQIFFLKLNTNSLVFLILASYDRFAEEQRGVYDWETCIMRLSLQIAHTEIDSALVNKLLFFPLLVEHSVLTVYSSLVFHTNFNSTTFHIYVLSIDCLHYFVLFNRY